MRQILFVGTILAAALPARAADDPPKANLLAPKEIADGWILLFDGETTFGWNAPDDSKWTIANGMLAPQAGKTGLLVTTTQFGEYELKLEYTAKQDSKARLLLGCDELGKERNNGHAIQFTSLGLGWHELTARVSNDGFSSEIRALGGGAGRGQGSKGDVQVSRANIALTGEGMVVRKVRLRPLGTQSLFNGKDLTGWKEFKGPKYTSKFTVTKEGWLNIKDGPGDLQTEGQYGDFVLQLECISNGKYLNSGVFFRCRPNEYQQGYEAQIRNQFTAEPTQEYVIEEYDPKTGELKDKKKIKSTAFDYGTGAIYRRMPARKEASKDGEWFTMTVIAHGRHIATWVNGIPVADWTDNRPLKDNARAGCRLEKGHISLQGHDPTTDLSFRNFRIVELPAEKK